MANPERRPPDAPPPQPATVLKLVRPEDAVIARKPTHWAVREVPIDFYTWTREEYALIPPELRPEGAVEDAQNGVVLVLREAGKLLVSLPSSSSRDCLSDRASRRGGPCSPPPAV